MKTEDPKHLRAVRLLPCLACGRPGPSEAHHVIAKGMGNSKGGDDFWNVIALCTDCHTQAPWAWHRNRNDFFRRSPWVLDYLKQLGWQFIRMNYKVKLIHPAYVNQKSKTQAHWEIDTNNLTATHGGSK